MSDSVRPNRRQPTGLPRPWDSLGKNTGVGCHFLLQCRKVKSESEVAQSCRTPSDPMVARRPQPTRLLHPWDLPGKSTGVGCHCLLQVSTIQQHNSVRIIHTSASSLASLLSPIPSFQSTDSMQSLSNYQLYLS